MFIRAFAGGILLAGMPGLAMAHHLMGGRVPDSLLTGLLSGLGHPVIGWDHLAFVVGVGVLASVAALGTGPIIAFVLGTLGGCLLHLGGADVPAAEAAIGLSLLVLAGLILLDRRNRPAIAAVLGLAGLFHGYAYGESIVGAEPTPLVAYLVGFAVIQAAIALGVRLLADRLAGSRAMAAGLARAAALVLAMGGAAALLA